MPSWLMSVQGMVLFVLGWGGALTMAVLADYYGSPWPLIPGVFLVALGIFGRRQEKRAKSWKDAKKP